METRPRTYLITGATGYLGSRVLRKLNLERANFYCLKRSTSNTNRVLDLEERINWLDVEDFDAARFFARNEIDIIIHCATDYGRKAVEPFQTIYANLNLPLTLLHYGSSAGVRCFINTDTVLNKHIDTYSLSKKHFSDWLERYSNRTITVNVSLQHFYGPEDDATKFTTSVIRSLIRREPRLKLTEGKQKRDFIYINDVVDAFACIIRSSLNMPKAGSTHSFEIGSGSPIAIKEFIHMVKRLTDNTETILDFGAVPYRKGEIMEIDSDYTKLSALGWRPKTSLAEGLMLTIVHERNLLT